MPTMNVSLTAEMADFVQSEIQSGRYVSASELVRESLRMLAYERALESEKAVILKAAIQAGIDDVEAGRISDRSVDDILQEVLAESRR